MGGISQLVYPDSCIAPGLWGVFILRWTLRDVSNIARHSTRVPKWATSRHYIPMEEDSLVQVLSTPHLHHFLHESGLHFVTILSHIADPNNFVTNATCCIPLDL